MKKRVLYYLVAVSATFSLQSCVTNYVVSTPTTYAKEYKSDAKLASIDNKKLETAKSQLLSSFSDEKLAAARLMEATIKNDEIAKTVRFTKKIDEILTEAESYLGTPYKYGGMTRRGIDCSAFVLSVFGAATGMTLPRSDDFKRIATEVLGLGQTRDDGMIWALTIHRDLPKGAFCINGGIDDHLMEVHHADVVGATEGAEDAASWKHFQGT